MHATIIATIAPVGPDVVAPAVLLMPYRRGAPSCVYRHLGCLRITWVFRLSVPKNPRHPRTFQPPPNRGILQLSTSRTEQIMGQSVQEAFLYPSPQVLMVLKRMGGWARAG